MDATPNSCYVPCVICSAVLRSEYLDVENILKTYTYGGVHFHGDGNYGSRVLDEDNGSFLYFVICDSCLKNRAFLMLFYKPSNILNGPTLINAKEEFCRNDMPPLHNYD